MKIQLTHATLLAAATLLPLLQACVVLPVPAPADEPRFTEQQLASVVPGTSTAESITRTLGPPLASLDFTRAEGRYRVYLWTQKGAGRWLFLSEDTIGLSPITETQFALFLRFDEQGALESSQLVEQKPSDEMTAQICSADGVCIVHPVGISSGGAAIHDRFVDSGSAFTVARPINSWEAPGHQCRVVLWLDKADWTTPSQHAKSFFGSIYEQPPGGIYIDYGPTQARTSWLPIDAYVVLAALPGERFVSFHNPWFYPNGSNVSIQPISGNVPFTCEAGRTDYVALGAASKQFGKEFGVVWRETTVDEAHSQMQKMNQLLLGDE